MNIKSLTQMVVALLFVACFAISCKADREITSIKSQMYVFTVMDKGIDWNNQPYLFVVACMEDIECISKGVDREVYNKLNVGEYIRAHSEEKLLEKEETRGAFGSLTFLSIIIFVILLYTKEIR